MSINKAFEYLSVGLPEDIERRKQYGDFEGAIRLIERRLSDPATPESLRNCMIVEREIMLRLPYDYPYAKDEALEMMRADIPDFSEEEFDELVDKAEISWIYIDGKMRFFQRFYKTLLKTNFDIARRAGKGENGSESAQSEPEHLRNMRAAVKEKGEFKNRITIRASIKIPDELFKPGQKAKVHLPVPKDCPEQSEITIIKMFPENGNIAPADAPQRTVCWEEIMEENHEFMVEYSYVYTARYNEPLKIKADAVQPSFDTGELQPHIAFTPYIKALTASLTEGLSDPVQKAKAIYDFITLNMHYTYMPQYFTLRNISECCARNFCGDCGVFALTFITLCRCAGIPARWESGLCAEPDFAGEHDWAKFYIAPYGWMFADLSFGISAKRCNDEERREYYFGNIDSFRMIANSEYQAPFTNDKKYFRADPFDNQCGEYETEERGFSSAEIDCNMDIIKYEIL